DAKKMFYSRCDTGNRITLFSIVFDIAIIMANDNIVQFLLIDLSVFYSLLSSKKSYVRSVYIAFNITSFTNSSNGFELFYNHIVLLLYRRAILIYKFMFMKILVPFYGNWNIASSACYFCCHGFAIKVLGFC